MSCPFDLGQHPGVHWDLPGGAASRCSGVRDLRHPLNCAEGCFDEHYIHRVLHEVPEGYYRLGVRVTVCHVPRDFVEHLQEYQWGGVEIGSVEGPCRRCLDAAQREALQRDAHSLLGEHPRGGRTAAGPGELRRGLLGDPLSGASYRDPRGCGG